MPLADGYESERRLKQIADEIASGITEMFKELGIEQTTSFCLFVVDHTSGTLQYISDLQREVADKMLKLHLARNEHN